MTFKDEDISAVEFDLSVFRVRPIEELRSVSMLEYINHKFSLDEEIALLEGAKKDYSEIDPGVREIAETRASKGKGSKGTMNETLQKAQGYLRLIEDKKRECYRLRSTTLAHLKNVKKFDALLVAVKNHNSIEAKNS